MKLVDIMAAIATPLQQWVATNRGKFRIAEDPTDPYVLLAGTGINTFVVILSLAEAPQTGGNILASEMQDVSFDVFVGRPMDLRPDPGAWLYKDPKGLATGKSLLKLIDEMREIVLGIGFAEEDTEPADAQNMGLGQVSLPDGVPLRAFRQKVNWTVRVG